MKLTRVLAKCRWQANCPGNMKDINEEEHNELCGTGLIMDAHAAF
jgi:hypothetical protein